MNPIVNPSVFDSAISKIQKVLPTLPNVLLGFLIGIVLVKLLTWVAEMLLGLGRWPRGLKDILVSLIHAVLWIFLIITTLNALGLGNLALILSGSVVAVGLALGSGISSLATDILGGISLSHDRDFNLGDEVIAGDKPVQGIVEKMDMRRTRIRAKDGKLHVIPNSVIERKEWVLIAKKSDLK